MLSKVARPADLNVKQVPDENPYELSSVIDSNEVEMKSHLKFTQLPQDPPPAPVPRKRVAETDISTGISTEHEVGPVSAVYKNPPPYRGRSQHGQHFYEEVGHQAGGVQKQVSKDSEYGSPSSLTQSHSHTEADQAILFSQSTTSSLAPLTDTVDRKPRKKVNPLYDSYREENGQAERQNDISKVEEPSKPASPVGCMGSILRHPCTTFLLFLLLVGLVVLFVLLLSGTITSKGGQTASQTQPLNASVTEEVVQLRKQVADQEKLMSDMMAKITHLEMAISFPGSENASVNAKIAHNTLQIMNLQKNVTMINSAVSSINPIAELAYLQSSQNIGTLAAYKNRIEALEAHTRSLNTSVNVLTGNLQTHSMDINGIRMMNNEQNNQLTMLQGEIGNVRQELDIKLQTYNDSIFEELAIVSKMQGPRGFNGSNGTPGTNLSRCAYHSGNSGSAVALDVTETSEVSPGTNEILTGVTCSTLGGARALLTSSGSNRFKCICSGEYNPIASIRYCYIHYWKCPIA